MEQAQERDRLRQPTVRALGYGYIPDGGELGTHGRRILVPISDDGCFLPFPPGRPLLSPRYEIQRKAECPCWSI